MSTTEQPMKPHRLAVPAGVVPDDVRVQVPVAVHKLAAAERERAEAEPMMQVIGVVGSPDAKVYYAIEKAKKKGEGPDEGQHYVRFQLLGGGLDGVPCLMTIEAYGEAKPRSRPKVGAVVTAVLQRTLTMPVGRGAIESAWRVVQMRVLRPSEAPEPLKVVAAEVLERSKAKRQQHSQQVMVAERRVVQRILAAFPDGLTADEVVSKAREEASASVEAKVKSLTEAIPLMLEDGQLQERSVDRDGEKVTVLVAAAPVPGAEEPEAEQEQEQDGPESQDEVATS